MISKALSDELIYQYGNFRRIFPYLFRRHLAYFFYIIGGCNLDCTYCWQREQEKAPGAFTDSSRRPLRPGDWVSVVRALPRPALIGLSGGEATLSPAFAPIIAAARNRALITVNTNGTFFSDPALAAMVEPHVRNISVSLDGFRAAHDASRNGVGLFDKVCVNIQRLHQACGRRKKSTLTIKTVLTDETVDDLPAFRNFCAKELGASTLNISMQKQGDHHQYSLLHHPDPAMAFGGQAELFPYARVDDIIRVVGGMMADRNNPCQVVLYPRIGDVATLRRFLEAGGRDVYAPCHLPRALITVLPDGEVIPCQSLGLGNVRDHGWRIQRVLDGRPAKTCFPCWINSGPTCRRHVGYAALPRWRKHGESRLAAAQFASKGSPGRWVAVLWEKSPSVTIDCEFVSK